MTVSSRTFARWYKVSLSHRRIHSILSGLKIVDSNICSTEMVLKTKEQEKNSRALELLTVCVPFAFSPDIVVLEICLSLIRRSHLLVWADFYHAPEVIVLTNIYELSLSTLSLSFSHSLFNGIASQPFTIAALNGFLRIPSVRSKFRY